MDEYIIGQTYFFEGQPYTYKGGDPTKRGSWRTVARDETPQDAALRRLNARGGSAIGDFFRMAAQGGTFGFGDELAGLGAAVVPGGQGYREARDDSRQRVEDLRLLNPGASLASEIAGAVPAGLRAGVSLTRALTRPGAGLVGQIGGAAGAGAAVGAAQGGLQAAGENTEGGLGGLLRDTGAGALGGAVAGGLLGGALQGGGAALGSTGRYAREVFQPASAARAEAGRTLRRAAEEAQIDPSQIRPALASLGDEAVIADLSPTLARIARDARNQAPSLDRAGGPVSKLATRQAERGERLARDMRRSAGIEQSMSGAKELAEKAVDEVRDQFYRPLEEAFPRVEGENVRNALSNLRVKAAARRTAQAVADRKRPPSFTELQDIMMDLRDDATAAKVAGRPNAAKKAQAAYRQILDAMKQDIPGFAEAQQQFARKSQVVESFDVGYGLWRKPARVIQEEMGKLTTDEARDAFRVGMLEHWEESLRTRVGGGAAANAIVKAGGEARAQMRALFGGDDAFNQFMRRRGLEETYGVTWNALADNSTTAAQLSDALHSLPGQGDIKNRVWDAIFNVNEARRLQSERVGEVLLGRDAQGFEQLIRQNPAVTGLLNIGRGSSGLVGGSGAGLFTPKK